MFKPLLFKPLAVLCVVPAAIVMTNGRYLPVSLYVGRSTNECQADGTVLDETLPANAAVITFIQSGAVAYYTGRQVVRYDLIHPQSLGHLLETLVRRGYRPVFLIDQQLEGPTYKHAVCVDQIRAARVAAARFLYCRDDDLVSGVCGRERRTRGSRDSTGCPALIK